MFRVCNSSIEIFFEKEKRVKMAIFGTKYGICVLCPVLVKLGYFLANEKTAK